MPACRGLDAQVANMSQYFFDKSQATIKNGDTTVADAQPSLTNRCTQRVGLVDAPRGGLMLDSH